MKSRRSLYQLLIFIIALIIYQATIYAQQIELNTGHFSEPARVTIIGHSQYAISQPQYRDDLPTAPLKLWHLTDGKLVRDLSAIDFAIDTNAEIIYLNQSANNNNTNRSTFPLVLSFNIATKRLAPTNFNYRINKVAKHDRLALSYNFSSILKPRNAFVYHLDSGTIKFSIPGELIDIDDNLTTAIIRNEGQFYLFNAPNHLTKIEAEQFHLNAYGTKLFSLSTDGHLSISDLDNDNFNNRSIKSASRFNRSISPMPFIFQQIIKVNHQGSAAILSDTDGTLVLYSNSRLYKLDLKEDALTIKFDNESDQLAILSRDSHLSLFNIDNGNLIARLPINEIDMATLSNCEIDIDFKQQSMIACGYDQFHRWQWATANAINNIDDKSSVNKVAHDSSISKVDHIGGELLTGYAPTSCRFSQNGEHLICQESFDEETSQLIVWNLRAKEFILSRPLGINELALNLPSLKINNEWAIARINNQISVHSLINDDNILTFDGSNAAINNSETAVLIASDRGYVTVYQLPEGKMINDRKISSKKIRSMLLNDDATIAIIIDDNGAMFLWRLSNNRLIQFPNNRYFSYAALNRDGKLLVSAQTDGTIQIWNTEDFSVQSFPLTINHPHKILLSKDSTRALILSGKMRLALLDLVNLTIINNYDNDEEIDMRELSVSDDLTYAAYSGKAWNLTNGHIIWQENANIAISPDGNSIAIASINGYEMRNLSNQQLQFTLHNYEKGWIITTADGFYDCSEGMEKFLILRNKITDSLEQNEKLLKVHYQKGLLRNLLINSDLIVKRK